MADGQKVDINFLEEPAFDQKTTISKNVSVLVLPLAIVKLQIQNGWKLLPIILILLQDPM